MNILSKLLFSFFGFGGLILFIVGLNYTLAGCDPNFNNCYGRIKQSSLKLIWNINCENNNIYNLLFFQYDGKECIFDSNKFLEKDSSFQYCQIQQLNIINGYKINDTYNVLKLKNNKCTIDLYNKFDEWQFGIIMFSIGGIFLFFVIIILILYLKKYF